jgi:hypothetical protein
MGIFLDFLMYVLYSTLLQLQPLIFYSVGRCCNRTLDSCVFGIGCQTLSPLGYITSTHCYISFTRQHLIHSATSHPRTATSHLLGYISSNRLHLINSAASHPRTATSHPRTATSHLLGYISSNRLPLSHARLHLIHTATSHPRTATSHPRKATSHPRMATSHPLESLQLFKMYDVPGSGLRRNGAQQGAQLQRGGAGGQVQVGRVHQHLHLRLTQHSTRSSHLGHQFWKHCQPL